MKGGGKRKVDNDILKLYTPLILQQTLGSIFFSRDRGPRNAGGAGGA